MMYAEGVIMGLNNQLNIQCMRCLQQNTLMYSSYATSFHPKRHLTIILQNCRECFLGILNGAPN